MRCPICLEGNALDILDDKKVDGKLIPIYICMCCDATGTRKELEVQSQSIIDNRYAYFHWPQCNLGLFFRNAYQFQRANKFSARMWVSTPSMEQNGTEIHFTGIGEDGLTALMERELVTKTLFPVNLWKTNRILDPKPSRTVTDKMMEEWKQHVPLVVLATTPGSRPREAGSIPARDA